MYGDLLAPRPRPINFQSTISATTASASGEHVRLEHVAYADVADNVSLLLDEEEEAAMRMLLDGVDDNDETVIRNETSTATTTTSCGLMAGARGGAACDVPEALANMEWT